MFIATDGWYFPVESHTTISVKNHQILLQSFQKLEVECKFLLRHYQENLYQ